MPIFTITGSEQLWKISGGSGCGPEFMGIRSTVEANDWKDALFKSMMQMELEWTYNLTGEWIDAEFEGDHHRITFKPNPNITKYIGIFDYGGKKYRGEKINLEHNDSDELPTANALIEIFDSSTKHDTELHLSEYMPDCVIEAILNSLM